MSLTIILPTYNEAENINPLIGMIKKYVPSASLLVVDDNSPDGTAKKVKNARVLLRTRNRGLTNSLRDAVAATHTDVVAWMDCDFSHPPDILPKLLLEIERGADIALAARRKNQGLSLMINRICMLLFGSDITDYTTGFLAARRTVLNQIPLRGNYGEYCIDLLVRAKRASFTIKEVSYASPPRRFGSSKTSLHFVVGYAKTVLQHIKL